MSISRCKRMHPKVTLRPTTLREFGWDPSHRNIIARLIKTKERCWLDCRFQCTASRGRFVWSIFTVHLNLQCEAILIVRYHQLIIARTVKCTCLGFYFHKCCDIVKVL